jgi:hypothetical protein
MAKDDRISLLLYLVTILITLLLAAPAMSVELFRYRGAAKDGGTLQYVFEAGEQNSPNAVTKEKAAEIAAGFMTTFYHVQVGALETQEFRTTPAFSVRVETGPSLGTSSIASRIIGSDSDPFSCPSTRFVNAPTAGHCSCTTQ